MRYIYVTCPDSQIRRHMVRIDTITGIVDIGKERHVKTTAGEYRAYEATDAIGIAMLYALRCDNACAYSAAEYDYTDGEMQGG